MIQKEINRIQVSNVPHNLCITGNNKANNLTNLFISSDQNIYVFNAKTNSIEKKIEPQTHVDSITSLSTSGALTISSSIDGSLTKIINGVVKERFCFDYYPILSCEFLNWKRIAVGFSNGKILLLESFNEKMSYLDYSNKNHLVPFALLQDDSTDGGFKFLCGADEGSVRVFDDKQNKSIKQVKCLSGCVLAMETSKEFVAVGGIDTDVKVYKKEHFL